MRIFVVGTGRCGTTTFARACGHMENYRSAHESTAGMRTATDLAFADDRIEVSPHLSWMLGPLMDANQVGTVLLVHLQRKRDEVIDSWMKRGAGRGPGLWTPLAMRSNAGSMSAGQYRSACGLCYDSIVSMIDSFFAQWETIPNMAKPAKVWLHEVDDWWPDFWKRIHARGDYQSSLSEWRVKHNAS